MTHRTAHTLGLRAWRQLDNQWIVEGTGSKERPVAYRVGEGWMVSGVRSSNELRDIVEIIEALEP